MLFHLDVATLTGPFRQSKELLGCAALTARYVIGWQGLTVGHAEGSPVTWDVDLADGFPFTGTLRVVDVKLHPDDPHDVHEIID